MNNVHHVIINVLHVQHQHQYVTHVNQIGVQLLYVHVQIHFMMMVCQHHVLVVIIVVKHAQIIQHAHHVNLKHQYIVD